MAQHTYIHHLLMKSAAVVLVAASLTLSAQAQIKVINPIAEPTTPVTKTVIPSTWVYIGPKNTLISPPNTPLGIGSLTVAGRVNAITYDPVNPSILYAATARGGIWKSVNKGAQWTCLSLANTYGYAFSCVTVDPTNDSIVYAGTGDYDETSSAGFGILKFTFASATSTTAYSVTQLGQSTTDRTQTSGIHTIRQITVDPTNDQHLLVAVGRDQTVAALLQYAQTVIPGNPPVNPVKPPDGFIWSSTNGGATWSSSASPIGNFFFSNIVYASHSGSQVLYASADFGGVFKSTNNGNSWSYLSSLNSYATIPLAFANPITPAAAGPASTYRVDVAVSPTSPNTLYVVSEVNKAVYKSTDGGSTWTTISGSIPNTDPAGNGTWSTAPYALCIACSTATLSSTGAQKQVGTTTTYDVLYVGLIDLFQSAQGGDGWAATGNVNSGNDIIHPIQHGVAVSPVQANEVSVANDGGVYNLIYAPAIANYNFTSLNATLGNMELYGGAFGFTDPTQILLTAVNAGNPHYDGDINNWKDPGPAPAWFAAINPLVPATQFVSTTFGAAGATMNFTEDDWDLTFGVSTLPVDNPANTAFPPNPHGPVVMDLYNPDLLYFGQQHVWQGVHKPGTPATPTKPPVIGTVTWTSQAVLLTNPDLNTNGSTDGDTIVALAVSQYNNSWLYAGTADGLFWYASTTSNWLRQDGYYEGVDASGAMIFNPNTNIPPYNVTGYFDNKSDWHVFHRAQITALAPGSKKTQKLFVGFNVPATYNPITNVSTTQYYGLFVCQDVTASAVDKAGVRVPKCAFTQINGTGPNALPAVPITSIQVLPHDNDQDIIVGTTIGVYFTSNGGTTWTNISNDGAFPAGIGVTHIRYEPSTSYLYATTNGRGVWAKYIPSDPTLNPLIKGNFQLYPTLQEYRGNRAKLSIAAQFYAGGQPINGTAQKGSPPVPQPFEYDISNLSASGWWINGTSVSGAYNIWFKVTGFLSKRMINTQIASNTLVSPLVYNGDCNPIYNANGQIVSYGDNVIDINDYDAVISHLGQIWTGPEDVDGDGIVTLRDLDIILANFGLMGDP